MPPSSYSYIPLHEREEFEPGSKPTTRSKQWRQRRLILALIVIVALGLLYLIYRISDSGLFGYYATSSASAASPWAFLGSGTGIDIKPAYDGPDDRQYPGGCMPYETRLWMKPEPLSAGKFKFPYMRPPPSCRTFNLSSLEATIEHMRTTIRDPDLFRLFENTYPNTLDTMIKWHGYANGTDPETGKEVVTDEELTYIITGDIDAMWLRDSAAQMNSYRNLLRPAKEMVKNPEHNRRASENDNTGDDTDKLASLWRGLINLQSRYVLTAPYCHSFQPPRESGIPPTNNTSYERNFPNPPYDRDRVFDCKWELDSLAYFLHASAVYYERTGDAAFFGRYRWIDAVEAAVDAAGDMRAGMYDEEGNVLDSAYSFRGWTDRGTETLNNFGLGNPSLANGMVRTSFRPSDDATIFQFLVPVNMMWAASLERASAVMERLAYPSMSSSQYVKAANLTRVMRQFAKGVRDGIDRDAVVHHRKFGDIFAYEVDGYGGVNLMDDANIPSLLSIPLLGYFDEHLQPPPSGDDKRATIGHAANHAAETGTPDKDERDYAQIYENTRQFVLSTANPYYAWGHPKGLATVGSPHVGPGKAWPMAAIVSALTLYNYDASSSSDRRSTSSGTNITDVSPQLDGRDQLVATQLNMLLNSTWGSGVMHESVDTWAPQVWTRAWFGWANGLFGELILAMSEDDEKRPEGERLLGRSWQ